MGNLPPDSAPNPVPEFYLHLMKIRLVWLALAVACFWPFVVCAQSDDASPENTSAFLKDMERKASVNSDDAKWVRRDFSYAFEDEAVGEDRPRLGFFSLSNH